MLEIIFVICVFIILQSFFIRLFKKIIADNSNELMSIETSCEHEWHMLGVPTFFGVDIYCPICKAEKNVGLHDWMKMKIDKKQSEKNQQE